MTGEQGPIFWRAGFVNLEEFNTIYQIRFKHILPEKGTCSGNCMCKGGMCTYGNIALDSIRLVCEAAHYKVGTSACTTRAVPFAGCAREATDYSSKGMK